MLQISTGMYFRDVDLYETLHSDEFFTNASVADTSAITMPFGTLTFSPEEDGISTVAIEATERLEGVDREGEPSFHKSTGGAELLDDAATVLAFFCNVTVSRHRPVLERSVAEPAHRPSKTPASILQRTFDPRVEVTSGDFDDLRVFCTTLLALNRREYDAAMRSMRKTVDATLMVGEDPGLAYTLLVAALESLAQISPASERELNWDRYEGKKRKILDPVLAKLPDEGAEEVRMAILDTDQLQLSRRFRVFTAAHIAPSYYRSEAEDVKWPLRAHDLENALTVAYQFRSKNVHTLADLNAKLWVLTDRADTLRWKERWVLSLQGLNRLCRHVIRAFVERSPAGVDPDFDYRLHLPGIVYGMELAPELWLGRIGADFKPKAAPRQLEGLVSLMVSVNAGWTQTPVAVDMDAVVEQIETQLPGLGTVAQRRPMVAIYVLWRSITPERTRPAAEKLLEKFGPDLDTPAIEAFAVHALFEQVPDWSPAAWADLAAQRRRDLIAGRGQQMPPSIDTALLLYASRFVSRADPEHARELMSQAVESAPGDPQLIQLEEMATDEREPRRLVMDISAYLRGEDGWVEVADVEEPTAPPRVDRTSVGEADRMDVPEPTWVMLREQMSRPALPEAWRRTGIWCIDALAEVLGPDWSVDAWKRDELPAFIAMPWVHRQAMLEFTEFALRMRILADTPGAAPVRRECRTDRRRARAAGTQLQLEVAGLALASGASIELESRTPGGYVADVVVDHPDAVLVVECAVVFVPDVERRFDDAFQWAAESLIRIGSGSTWDLTAEVATKDLAGLRVDLEDLELALTLSDPLLPVRFERPWGHVLAVPGEGGLRSIRNTATGTDYGRHLVGKLRGKAAQTAGVDGVWLRADVRSGLWQGTAWSQEDLATKAGQLAALVSPMFVDAPWVAGAVLTSGPCIINGDVHEEDAAPVPGVCALRRALPAGRVRETVIIAADGADPRQADMWRSLYDGEPAWLPAALAAEGLGPLDDIFGPGADAPGA